LTVNPRSLPGEASEFVLLYRHPWTGASGAHLMDARYPYLEPPQKRRPCWRLCGTRVRVGGNHALNKWSRARSIRL